VLLFHVVVDDQNQASKLLDLLRKQSGGQGGRITCLPLNKLLVAATPYPNAFGKDAVPLTDYVKCPPEVQKAINHVRPPSPSIMRLGPFMPPPLPSPPTPSLLPSHGGPCGLIQ